MKFATKRSVPRCAKEYKYTLEELWGERNAQSRTCIGLTKEERLHLAALFKEYHENSGKENRSQRRKVRKTICRFLTNHGLPCVVVSNGDKKGIHDVFGRRVIPAIYDKFCINYDKIFPMNWFVCSKDDKWGVVDNHHRIQLPFEYDCIFRLYDSRNLFFVEREGKKGLVSLKDSCSFVIPCEMDDIYYNH